MECSGSSEVRLKG